MLLKSCCFSASRVTGLCRFDPFATASASDRYLRGTTAQGRREPDDASPFAINPAQPGQSYTSVCSANSKASSTSMPR